MSDLIAAVRAYATKNYEKDGWDVLVECWSDEDIAENIGRANTVRGALYKVSKAVKMYDSYRKDIQATAF